MSALRRHGYVVSIAVVALATLAFLPLRGVLGYSHIAWLYLCIVGLMAWLAGTRPAILGALVSFVAGNYFFTQPYRTLSVADPRDVIQLVVFLGGATAVGVLTGREREREIEAVREEQEATALARLAAEMAEGASVDTVIDRALASLVRLTAVESVTVWIVRPEGELVALGPGARFVTERDHGLASRAFADVKAIGLPETPHGSDRLGSGWPARDVRISDSCCGTFLPLVSATDIEGVLQLLPGSEGLADRDYSLAISISHLLAVFLAGQGAVEAAARASAAAEADQVKSAIVSAVSHELKTPLASAMAAVTDLAAEGIERDPADVRHRLDTVADDLRRLEAAIGDLLDLSRLHAEEWLPHPETYEAGEILADAVASVGPEVRDRLEFDVLESPAAAVYVDFAQVARALRAILENAVAYSPGGTPIILGAARTDGMTRVWIEDRGPGVSDQDKPFVFDRAYRGEAGHSVVSGTGLGLTIARDLVSANGGRLSVEDASPKGARFVLEVPAAPPEPKNGGRPGV